MGGCRDACAGEHRTSRGECLLEGLWLFVCFFTHPFVHAMPCYVMDAGRLVVLCWHAALCAVLCWLAGCAVLAGCF